jgi:hypothetical protein
VLIYRQKTVVAGEVSNVTKQGLRSTLGWAATEMRHALRAVQQGASSGIATASHSRPSFPGTASTANPHPPNMRRLSMQSQAGLVATPRQESQSMHISPLADPLRLDQQQRNLSESFGDRFRSSYESLPPIVPPDEMKRGQHYEPSAPGSAQSPRTSSGSSIYGTGTGQSPMQSLNLGRSLPSPPGSHFNHHGLPTSAQAHAAHASHLQDLQHQISTKTLALQTLQREHDQLLAAFSRSQIRCNTLDKKSQVSDHEINTLTEEKIRLQQQVETLESQVEDLSQARDDVQRQSSADGAQYRQIMAMSSKLQMKSAEEAKAFKAAKDAWNQEREELEQRLVELESRPDDSMSGDKAKDRAASAETGDRDVLESHSLHALRAEVLRLRQRLADLESLLQEVTGETEKAMVKIRARISGQTVVEDDSGRD